MYLLPASGPGPGFSSTPDMIKSICVTFDTTKRYDNIRKEFIMVFGFNLLPMDPLLEPPAIFFPTKVPILDLY